MAEVEISGSYWPEGDELESFRRAALLPPQESPVQGRVYRENLWVRAGGRSGLLVGYARLIQDSGDLPWIDEIAVIPEYRDEGIEEELMNRLLSVFAVLPNAQTVLVGTARAPVDISDLAALKQNLLGHIARRPSES